MAVCTLALGIGATTSLFTVINAVLLNPLPYPQPDRLVLVSSIVENAREDAPITYPDYLDWRAQSTHFEQLGYVRERPVNLTGVDEPARIPAAEVSADIFPALGLRPIMGRWITAEDDRPAASPVVVLSHAAWLNRFNADPAILQRTLALDGRVYTVVGVMPPRFRFWNADAWIPAGLFADTDLMRSRTLRMNGFALGRLRPGVKTAAAQDALDVISHRAAVANNLSTEFTRTTRVEPFAAVQSRAIRPVLLVLLGAVGCVLLIACVNVANLLLARNLGRVREIALRSALGANRGQVIRQLLLEALPLAALGALGGLLLAVWTTGGLVRLLPADALPAEAEIGIDRWVLLFTGAIAVGAALLASLMPALQLTRVDAAEALKDSSHSATVGHRGRRARSTLIAVEVALAVTLLVGAGLLARSLARLQHVDPGFRADHTLALTLQLPEAKYPGSAQVANFLDRVFTNLRSLPATQAAGAVFALPLGGSNADFSILVEGRTYAADEQVESTHFNIVAGDYFAAQGIPLRAGRAITDADHRTSEPVVVVNAAFVRRFLPEGDPLGRRIRPGVPESQLRPGMLPPGFDQFRWATIVGVAEDVRHVALAQAAPPMIYLPRAQIPEISILHNNFTLLVRTQGDPVAIAQDARQALWQVDRDVPISRLERMQTIVAGTLRQSEFSTFLLSSLAGLAAVLAMLGISGVIGWTVRQRQRELGIRLALGAQPRELLGLVLRQGFRPVLIGLVAGLAAAAALSRLLSSQLHEISPLDPLSFGAVALLLLVVAGLAAVVPARRATKVDPMIALRAE